MPPQTNYYPNNTNNKAGDLKSDKLNKVVSTSDIGSVQYPKMYEKLVLQLIKTLS